MSMRPDVSLSTALHIAETLIACNLTRSVVFCTDQIDELHLNLLARLGEDNVRLWTGAQDQYDALLDEKKVIVAPHDFLPTNFSGRTYLLNRVVVFSVDASLNEMIGAGGSRPQPGTNTRKFATKAAVPRDTLVPVFRAGRPIGDA